MSRPPKTTDEAVRIERSLPAPIEEVFAAWTDAATMSEWFSPRGEALVEADPRPGGRLRVVMIGDGTRIEHAGRFLEVEPPTRLVFTWRSRFTGERDSRVTIELEPAGQETRLTLAHELLTPEQAESHAGGWAGILDRLAEVLAAPQQAASR